MSSSLTPSGNDPRLNGPASWYVDGDRQTGTRKDSGAIDKEKIRPAIKVRGRVFKGDPGEKVKDIIQKVPDGENIYPYNMGYIDDDGKFQVRSESLIAQVLELSSNTRSRGSGSNVDLEKKIEKSGGPKAVLKPDPSFQISEPPKGFPAKTVLDKSGTTQFQVMHPAQLRIKK